MASRLLAQVILIGSTYVARAFVQAYQQALINSARGGAGGSRGAARAIRGRLHAEEAAQILGVSKDSGLKDIYKRYDRLFNANDPTKGGSIYLQAKIHNAKMELEREAIARGESPRPSPDTTQDGNGQGSKQDST